jgi:lipopolysaccharide/colanic/teichoic acid biosynthesis glycosyltransferase
VWYVDHVSFKTDIEIVWTTLRKVLQRADISEEGHATMEFFNGHN